MNQPAINDVTLKNDIPVNSSKIVSEALPILHTLQTRIRAYAKLWCITGALTLLLILPALLAGEKLLALTTSITGLSVLFFSIVRIIESKSISAIIEIDRSDLRRKVWLAVNSIVFLSSLAIFFTCILKSDTTLFNPWMALPVSTFLMIVSVSPLWEWFFVRRVIRANKTLLEDFNRYLQIFFTTSEERQTALLAIDALMTLEALRNKKLLSEATYQTVVKELLKIEII